MAWLCQESPLIHQHLNALRPKEVSILLSRASRACQCLLLSATHLGCIRHLLKMYLAVELKMPTMTLSQRLYSPHNNEDAIA